MWVNLVLLLFIQITVPYLAEKLFNKQITEFN